jgi:hypothetical protein
VQLQLIRVSPFDCDMVQAITQAVEQWLKQHGSHLAALFDGDERLPTSP